MKVLLSVIRMYMQNVLIFLIQLTYENPDYKEILEDDYYNELIEECELYMIFDVSFYIYFLYIHICKFSPLQKFFWLRLLACDSLFGSLQKVCKTFNFFFQEKTAPIIHQSILVHFVLAKRKPVVDQMCKGLEILVVLEQIRMHSDFYENVFVAQNEISSRDILDAIKFEDSNECNNYFIKFVEDASFKNVSQNIVVYN